MDIVGGQVTICRVLFTVAVNCNMQGPPDLILKETAFVMPDFPGPAGPQESDMSADLKMLTRSASPLQGEDFAADTDPYDGICDEAIYGQLPRPCEIFEEYPVLNWTDEKRAQLTRAISGGRITTEQARHFFHLLPQQVNAWMKEYS